MARKRTEDPLESWHRYNSEHARRLHALDRAIERSHRITACELDVLGRIAAADGGSLRIQALAETVLRSPSAISRMVVRFETEGLVTRTADERDRRGTVATITPDGRARLAAAEDTARVVLAEIMQS